MKKSAMTRFSLLLATACIVLTSQLDGRRSKGYTKKSMYSGYGKPSKVNGKIKTKSTSGHFKKTSKGHTYVFSYSRSK